MTTAAPFPFSEASSSARPVQLIPERNEFVPSWYTKPHTHADKLLVKQGGLPLGEGFTVSEVPPERRWAIREDGELLSQLEFHDLYQRKLLDWFRYASTEGQQGRGKVPSSFAVHREPVPNVAEYVSWTIDPRDARKLLPIGYDPDATKGATAKRVWLSEEERWAEGPERLALLVTAFKEEQNGGRRTLKPHEVLEVEAHLAGASPLGTQMVNATQAKVEAYTELLRDGEITQEQYAEKVAALFGGAKPEPLPQTGVAKGYRRMACGEVVINLMVKRHKDGCSICR